MMKKTITVFLIILVISSLSFADVYWDDNLPHTLDNSNHISGTVFLDRSTVNNPGTSVNMLQGGYVSQHLTAWNSAKVYMLGGSTGVDLRGYNNSEITLTGGVIGNNLQAFHQTNINMSGGQVNDGAELFDNSTLNMTGGYIREVLQGGNVITTMSGGSTNLLSTGEDGIIYLEGNDFIVTDLQGNSTNLSSGDRLSNYGSLVQTINSDSQPVFRLEGNISGFLNDGSVLDVPFRIYNMGMYEGISDIIIVPEPCSLLLIGAGCLFIRRRRKA